MISSRTPEGEPNHCPVCAANVDVEHSILFGDATCPNCGSLLWYYGDPADRIFLGHQSSTSLRDLAIKRMATQLGVSPAELMHNPPRWDDLDSLDSVEIMMMFEEFAGESQL